MAKRLSMTRRLSYNRVVLAVYWLTNPGDDTVCQASVREIAKCAGLPETTTRRRLREMEERGLIGVFHAEGDTERRTAVLLDHFASDAYLALYGIEYKERLSPRSQTARQRLAPLLELDATLFGTTGSLK